MKFKIEYTTIAERVRGKIVARRPLNYSLSDKESRFLSESVVKEFGGLKVYSNQDEHASAYNILGIEDYVFFDRSVIRLDGTKIYIIDGFMQGVDYVSFYTNECYGELRLIELVNQNINKQLNEIKGVRLIQLKIKCQMQLPVGELW